MKPASTFFLVIVFITFAAMATAAPVNISATASFNGGVSGSWSFQYTQGADDLFLQKITINLNPTALRFDTAAGGFGSLASQDISNFSGTDTITGLQPGYVQGAALDGGAFVEFSFDHFAPGMVFQFQADVDDFPNPTLATIEDCSKLPFLQRGGCALANIGRAAANTAALAGAELVGPNDMAGGSVAFTFGGANYPQSRTIVGTFGTVTFQDVITRLLQGDGGGAFANDAPAEAPEPATFAIFGAGLAGIMFMRRLRHRG